MTYQTFETIAHATRLYQAGMEQELRQFILSLDASTYADVTQALPWLNQLSLATSTITDTNLPATVYARSEGWRHYFKGDYIEAHDYFVQSLTHDDWQQLASNTALGMAKVYTRSGYWQLARDWVLYYLKLARTLRDDYGLVKGYGALAEIFLRAGSPKQALACFQISNQMMPSGQGQLDKQYNFIASALIRNGEYLRAETLLRNSMKLSRDKIERTPNNVVAKTGYLHSYSRLCYLQLAQYKPITLAEPARSWIKNAQPHGAKVPAGFIHVALMINDYYQGLFESANKHLAQAITLFSKTAPMEQQWVLNIQAYIKSNNELDAENKAVDKHQADDTYEPTAIDSVQALLSLEMVSPPQAKLMVDATWQQVTLPNDGYTVLLQSEVSLQTLTEQWRLFFI